MLHLGEQRRALVGLGVGAVPMLEHDHVGNGDVEGKARNEVAVHGLGVDDEDDGWLLDIVYDKNTDTSELCIWDARQIAKSAEPVAKVKAPHRVPYGVHGLFLTPEELQRQWQQ